MSESPKRIWITQDSAEERASDFYGGIVYVREDLVEGLVDALIDAHGTFRAYEGIHNARGATDKAERNARYAKGIEDALAKLRECHD